MPQFSYKARRRTGETVQGTVDVADRSAALAQIERLGLFPIMVDAARGSAAAAAERPAAGREATSLLPEAARRFLKRKRKPRMQELATYTQQMVNLLSCGMPVTVALNSMTHLESKGISSQVSKDLRQEVMEGRSLSDAMAKQPRVFSDLYINMVRAGEQSGALVEVLRRMAHHYQQFSEVQGKFAAAMIYPAMVCLVGLILILFFIYVMLPQFVGMFTSFTNIELPLPTRMLIAASYVFTHYWWLLIFIVMAIGGIFARYRSTADGRRKMDEFKMKAPIFGKVVKLNLFAQFSRTLATLLQNGVPVLTALQITEAVIPNTLLKEAIAKTREAVTDGKTIAQPLATSKLFPQLMVDLVKIGEETGDVPGALANLADTYEGELQIALRILTNLIEPLLILVMAVGVGFLLLSVLLPMFRLIANINRG